MESHQTALCCTHCVRLYFRQGFSPHLLSSTDLPTDELFQLMRTPFDFERLSGRCFCLLIQAQNLVGRFQAHLEYPEVLNKTSRQSKLAATLRVLIIPCPFYTPPSLHKRALIFQVKKILHKMALPSRKMLPQTGQIRNLYCLAVRSLVGSGFHSSSTAVAGENYRLRHGLARSGNEYGPLTDVPDWSFADGRTAPVSKAQKHRNKRQYAIGLRIKTLLNEIDNAKETRPPTEEARTTSPPVTESQGASTKAAQ